MQLRFGINAAIDVEVLIYGCCSEFAGSPLKTFVTNCGEICFGWFL